MAVRRTRDASVLQEMEAADSSAQASLAEAKSTALPVVQSDGPALTQEITSSDVTMPRIRLAQPISRVVAQLQAIRAGQWYLTQSQRALGEAIRIVPINMLKHLALFVPGMSTVKCRSMDLVRGVGDPGIDCNTCTLKNWPAGGGAPPCSLFYNYLCLVLPIDVDPNALTEDQLLPEEGILNMAVITLGRTSAGAGKNLNGAYQQSMDPRWYRYSYVLSSEMKTNQKGVFYVAQAQVGGPLKVDSPLFQLAKMQADRLPSIRTVVEGAGTDADY